MRASTFSLSFKLKRIMKKGMKWWGVVLTFLITVTTLSFKNSVPSSPANKQNVERDTTKNFSNESLSSMDIFNGDLLTLYKLADLESAGLNFDVLKKAMTGYHNLKDLNLLPKDKALLTVVDFTKPSTEKRLWVIDLAAQKILFNTFVAHGQGSGETVAEKFSNITNSFQSSVGFYSTAEVYTGKHGRSLKLDGLDADLNGKARERAIVVHGADYVSQEFINRTGRLGRSQGCPALPMNLFTDVIDNIKGNTLLFINGNGVDTSDYLKEIDHTDSKNQA